VSRHPPKGKRGDEAADAGLGEADPLRGSLEVQLLRVDEKGLELVEVHVGLFVVASMSGSMLLAHRSLHNCPLILQARAPKISGVRGSSTAASPADPAARGVIRPLPRPWPARAPVAGRTPRYCRVRGRLAGGLGHRAPPGAWAQASDGGSEIAGGTTSDWCRRSGLPQLPALRPDAAAPASRSMPAGRKPQPAPCGTTDLMGRRPS
jgi:hypothetical protein